MKKSLIGIICFFAGILSIQAQTLYGTTPRGGNEGAGTINKFMPATNNLTVAKSFESFAAHPWGTLIQASDGKLYGMTSDGGSNGNDGHWDQGNGVIFSFDPSTSAYKKLKDFDGTNGADPQGSLMQASDGKLYGMTTHGGSYGYEEDWYQGNGVIFSFDPSTSTYAKLKDFDSINGRNPYGGLMQASNGKLYGMTSGGGSSNAGVIFSFDPSSSTYKKLKEFNGTNGANPVESLMQASDGKLYGMTSQGGSSGNGVIFSFDPSTSTYKKLKNFDGTNGANPSGSLIQAIDGKLYGTTVGGGSGEYGVIFSFDPSSSTYTKLKDFDGVNGAAPYDNLMQTSDGKLYGMTTYGGSEDIGVIFSFDPSSSTYAKLKDFDYDNGDGINPSGSLMQASDGKLYGMTNDGGSRYDGPRGGYGVIFSFDPSVSTYTKLKDFGSNETGSNVSASLLRASDGKLYGMTTNGGSNSLGVIFSFDPSSSTYTKLKDFDRINGSNPLGSLIQASDGKLYGMTEMVGSSNFGVIFSFDPSSSTYSILKAFDGNDGGNPQGNLIEASDGKLYGMTTYGGSSNTNGDLWNGHGVIFSFDPSTSTYMKLKDFDYTNGARPFGSLIQASDGKLYGMTLRGGSSEYGVIFSFDPSSSTYTKLKDFDGINGAGTNGSLIQASDGKLYGMTAAGGSTNQGFIFSFDPSSSTYKKLKDYDGANGANPGIGSAFIEVRDNQNGAPTVNLTKPTNNATYIAPANVKLTATATDKDGTISKVEFYNGTHLLHTEYVAPYSFKWSHVPAGKYTLTAKATDNSGLVTTSAAVHISIVPDKAPTVRIIKPHNNQSFAAPAYISLKANAKDRGGRITRVEFYNGTILLRTEYKHPYRYVWKKVPAGTYTITAKAYNDKGLSATSKAVKIKVTNASIVSRPSSVNIKTDLNGALSMRLSPVPARSTLQIYTKGLQLNRPSTISVLSSTGVLMKTIQSNASNKVVQLDVSTLVSGVYTIKVMSGDKVMYKQFVKL